MVEKARSSMGFNKISLLIYCIPKINIDTESTMPMNKLVSTFAHETREIAHETSFLLRSRNEV